ncbi:sarcosine oxidase [Kribbella sp. VKM Ac-2527]|uniref:Sarcosine oxidase n=1 Tax=Kribbella caucasensis TaxID=2512215 RepID=A0A4R6KEN4_9ACTN|nr:N-methyl-L-tryptophan oxidase [Kribbella sp. VKM Ac-2527]TDO48475.1 sarcosine oxidase [Kribbella sp. VKM Ac-2527]
MSRAEVAVIGLGAIGSMTLWRLAERGVSVHGYERFGVAHDRGASAGQTRRFSVQSQREPRLTPLAMEAFDLWRELADLSGRELFRQTGGVIIGPEGRPSIVSAIASAREYELPHESLGPDALRSRFPQHVVRDSDVGVTDPFAGYLRPEASVASAVERATALGAEVSLYTEVIGIEPRADGVAVITRDGEVTYERVVLAPGAWAGDLVPGAAQLVVPRRLVQAWYLARRPADYRPETFCVFERVGDVSAYGFPSLDGLTIKIGVKFEAHPVIDDLGNVQRSVDVGHAVRLAGVIREFFPGLYPDPVTLVTGIEGYSPDDQPLVGLAPADPRLVIACGFSGAGFKFAPVMGDIVADFATTGSTTRDASFLTPGRHLAATSLGAS